MWVFSKKIILKFALLYTVKKEFFYWSITSKGYSHVTDILCPGGGGWWGQYLGHWLSLYNNQTCTVSSSKGVLHSVNIYCKFIQNLQNLQKGSGTSVFHKHIFSFFLICFFSRVSFVCLYTRYLQRFKKIYIF